MKRASTHLLLFMMMILVMAGGVHAQPVTDADRAEIANAVVDLTEAGRLAAEKVEPAERVFDALIGGDDALFITQGDLLRSREAIIASRQPSSDKASQKITVEERHVYVLSPTSAVLSEKGYFTGTFKDGRRQDTIYYGLTLVYHKVGGVWKIVHGHQSFP